MNASGAAPGEYTVDVIMNGKIVDSQIKIDFTEQDNELTARLTPQQLERWGIDTNKLSVSSHLLTSKILHILFRAQQRNSMRTTKS